MAYADVNEQRIYYEDSGGAGPAVLFSHGFLMDHEMWEPQVEALADRYRCVTWDERGFGQTVSSAAPFTYWDLADDAVGLLDHLGIEQAVWCGMSQGGFLSFRAALAHPDRVRALVLVDTSPGAEHAEVVTLYQAMFDQSLAEGMTPDLVDAVCATLFGPGFDASVWRGKMSSRSPASTTEAVACMLGRDDVSDRVGEISCPALVVHGELDAGISVDEVAGWAERLPGLAGTVLVPDAGHTANLERPEAVNPPLVEFLDGLS